MSEARTTSSAKRKRIFVYLSASVLLLLIVIGSMGRNGWLPRTDAMTVADQSGKLRRSITNGLGQLVRVDEPNSSNALGTVASPNQATSYAYDTLNNLTTVTQGSQTRTFTYSSLARLLSATNPESGTISYVYDPNGNLTSKTDARSIVTSFTYDVLNRVTDRDYSDLTPDVDYFYGTTAPKVGKLTKVTSSVSTTEYTSFDILGRVTGHKQTTDGVDYTTGYTYKLSGALDEQTYPSGRVVKNELDVSGDLASVSSKENSSAIFKTYANDFTYNAAGAVSSLRLGNGRFESTQFNNRLQPTQIALGSSVGDAGLLKIDYTYNSSGNNDNNGNLLSQTITVPGLGHPFVQTYIYDELNRLKSATETNNSAQTWKQTFTFDRYGNRRFDEANTTIPASFSNQALTNPTISTANNRLNSSGWTFDSAGNTTGDPNSRTFYYDSENKQTEVKNSSNTTIGQYTYDGDGRRVKKYVPSTGETTIFIYDAASKSIAEYSTIVKDSVYAKVAYISSDHLGSPRLNTDAIGSVNSRHDYLPFGEEISTTNRTSILGYTSDTIRKQFTGYERDNETELDFAQARMYRNVVGRFTSPDPYNLILESVDAEKRKKGDGRKLFDDYISQSQNWNRYVYVWNNPLKNTDPNGEKVYVVLYTTGNSKGDDEFKRAAETKAQHIREDGRFDPKKDTVLLRGVRTKEDVQTAFNDAAGLEKNYGKVLQVQIFSHADKDGPIFHPPGSGPSNGSDGVQWTANEVRNLKINWAAPESEAFFFGCNSADFAQTFASAQYVTSWGYDRYAYFSSARTGYRTEPQPTGPLYLVGADGNANGIYSGAKYALGYGKIYLMVKKTP